MNDLPRIEILSGSPDETERALIAAAVLSLPALQPQPEPAQAPGLRPWMRAALFESLECRTIAPTAPALARTLWPD